MKKLFLLFFLLASVGWGQTATTFYETFEGGVAGMTWSGTPATISSNSDMTGSYNLLDPSNSYVVGQTSMAADKFCAEFQWRRIGGNPSDAHQVTFDVRDSGATVLSSLTYRTDCAMTTNAPGTTQITVQGCASTATNYTFEICGEKGTGANAKAKSRVNGGAFTERTNGTWTTQFHDWRVRRSSTGTSPPNVRFDEIKFCRGTYTGVADCDFVAPTVGGGGTITTASVAQTTLTLNWTKATDVFAAQNTLLYTVYRSTSNNISTVALAEANGTALVTDSTDIATYNVTGLTAGTLYYFNVVVRDPTGWKSIYTTKSETTLAVSRPGGGVTSGGSWPPPYMITPETLPEGDTDVAYAGADLEAISGVSPFTWSVFSGSLPTGITLSSAGVLSGTPTGAGTFNFTAKSATALGGNAYQAFSIVINAGAPPPTPEPWQLTSHLDAAAVRTHYMSQSSAGSGNASSCANAESIATAVGHYVAGDHHLACGATYTGTVTLSRSCTEAQPCVFRSVVSATTGTPEDAYFSGGILTTGSWVSVRGMRFGSTTDNGIPGIELRGTGDSAINNFIYDHKGPGGIFSFPYAGKFLDYGNVLVNNGICGEGPGGGGSEHNFYGHSKGHVFGTRYVIQLVSLDGLCGGGALARWNFHGYNSSSGSDTRANRWHVQDGVFQSGSFVMGTQAVGQPDEANVIKGNWFFSLTQGTQWRVGYTNVFQGTVTGNLWYNTALQWRMWGNGGTTYTKPGPTTFSGNEIISPQSSKFLSEFWTRTYTAATTLGTQGAPKIDDNIVWNTNTYRIASGGTFNVHCNGTNSGDVTFAGWKTATDNCRVTPDGGDANGFDVGSTFTSTLRTVDVAECFDNYYQAGWGYCRIANWDGNTSVVIPAAEAQKVIGSAKDYNIWNIRTGPYTARGAALETGTCGTPCADITVTPLPSATDGLILLYITSAP